MARIIANPWILPCCSLRVCELPDVRKTHADCASCDPNKPATFETSWTANNNIGASRSTSEIIILLRRLYPGLFKSPLL